MRLKIGDLAKKAGLSVRALHHYDAIGLLSPSQRTEGGARLYGRDDLIRLHRIEALKRFGYSLPDIKASLDGQFADPPLLLLQRQIAELDAQASRAQRLGRHLRYIVDMIATDGETTTTDWLNALELMNMVQKHLDDDEFDALLAAGPESMPSTDPAWSALIDEVREAVQRPSPTDSDAAMALAWRWIRLVVRMTRNDPTLAAKLMTMQLDEPRAPQLVGITAPMLAWIDEAFVHARCALFAKYLGAAQMSEVRNRQFAMMNSRAWPALVGDLRAQMEDGVDAGAAPVQAIVKRWQQLFRDSFCGEDKVLEARVLDVMMREPDLQLGVGIDDALLAYLHQANFAGHGVIAANAGPKPSALMVATQRAAHQLLDRPLVLDDPVALAVLGATEAQAVHDNIDRFRHPASVGLRSSVIVRSRLADDVWAAAIERGVRQYVVLGAGLDTSAYRHPHAAERIFEVDLPATQAWKQARLREAGIALPPSLHFVPVDFERVGLAEGLARAGFDADAPAIFSWLGVTMYLDEAAVIDTLRFVVDRSEGSAVLFDYALPLSSLPPILRIAMEQMTSQFAERGEPWKSFFEPAALAEKLVSLGFTQCTTWTPDDLNQRYFSNRTDALLLGEAPTRLVLATV
ncbi:SAM-dependent methyltransferase [Burkholderia contaminans]|uniref:SAM-dependent methyltransferase n=1 Tax=Burkholderia contaminans TaxID=488447 RepID=A0A0G3Z4R5_9BURK|nr:MULTISPECIES: SAM-dependent methyltransferase [Burkholderia]AKM45261.1 MerR family transcriptional regulator [Burkholderia contaminans]AOL08528.1 MerR family transcriptional regulator [Burkholderia contaminans]ELK6462083.1 SAM-dependent methyltransferase [Burkholderia contaminans]RQT11557.1 SAM-dependent methyltransferase [Burkholderia contaminans]RQT18977.1 SAM-dependent methyltransferase [Burkholderia contaminans]